MSAEAKRKLALMTPEQRKRREKRIKWIYAPLVIIGLLSIPHLIDAIPL